MARQIKRSVKCLEIKNFISWSVVCFILLIFLTLVFAQSLDLTQVNDDAFGVGGNTGGYSMTILGGYLYVGTSGVGAVWRTSNGTTWTQVNTNGFGNSNNTCIGAMGNLSGYIYAGTWNTTDGAEIWESPNGTTWNNVISGGYGNTNCRYVDSMAVFGGDLYVGVTNPTNGAEIWKKTGGSGWSHAETGGFGVTDNDGVYAMAVFGSYLYAGTQNWTTGAQIWRSSNGTDWTQVEDNGFGNTDNGAIFAMAVFGTKLFVVVYNQEIWGRIYYTYNGTTWHPVASPWDSNNWSSEAMAVFEDYLYVGTRNDTSGTELWGSATGTGDWTQVNIDGFGDANNTGITSMAVFNSLLYMGTYNSTTGAEVWRGSISKPDLVVTSIDAPSSATEGDTINVSNTVKNQGILSADSFYIYFYLSPDTTITTSDTKFGERYVSSLSAGASSPDTTPLTLPSGVTGFYYVGAIVDVTGSVSESNENNNTGYDSTPIDISPAPSGPDLVVTSIAAPNSATEGDTINVSNTVKNQGTLSADSFYIYFYLSPDTTITTSDTKFGERYVSSLSAGASSPDTTPLTLPSGVTGSYYVGAIADVTGSVSESNENNNAGYDSTPTDINPGPNLQVSDFYLDFGEVVKGETETKTFTISNSGAGTLSGTITTDRSWISVDPVSFDSNYVTVWVIVYTAPLEVWKTYTGTVTVDSNGGVETINVSILPTCVKSYPNPYSLSSGKPLTFWGTGVPHAAIKIYTLSGELVKTLKETNGEDKITWDGRNEDGQRIVRGIYFFTTKNPKERNTGKFTIVR